MAQPINSPILRLLDANANRAREALRVLEDFARFVLDDRDTSAALKSIRHEMATLLAALLPEAILHRDTPNDVGRASKTGAEFHRQDIGDVVTAAGKRLGEALRAIEEYLKTLSPAQAASIEQLRYRFYDVEQRLARGLRPAGLLANVQLYVLISEKSCRLPWLQAAEQAILGGADCLQLREKELNDSELLRRARQLVRLCHQAGKLCVINDRPDIAILSGADGVHVGQEDLPVVEVRKLVGLEKIVGVSTHNIEQAKRAWLDGADYIGVGPVFPSATKPRSFLAGVGFARQVAAEIPLPAIAIAGITAANVDEVLGVGVRAIAVTAAVLDTDDPRAAAAELKGKLMVGRTSTRVGQTFMSAAPESKQDGRHECLPHHGSQEDGNEADRNVCRTD